MARRTRPFLPFAVSASGVQDHPTGTAPGEQPSDAAVDTMSDEQLEHQVVQGAIPTSPTAVASLSFMDKVEAFIARLSTRNNFWHRVCSMIWLPYAFRSGIHMKRVGSDTFQAVLPFKRFNRNWYNAMAGAALLANSEIAGGLYIFGITGGDYTLVCKHLSYDFLRPCFGPAVYRVTPREDLKALIATGKEFNLTVDLEIIQQPLLPQSIAKLKKQDRLMARLAAKERRVGKCVATFHLTPATHQKSKRGDIRRVG